MPETGELLRARGMRSTPQRRAILAAFHGGEAEHLSADEVFARAAESLPDLSRGTVYATLAEFTEAGLLAALGSPEPVRYETNTEDHAHFRCRLCLRIFDLAIGPPDPESLQPRGYTVEWIDVRAQGICRECGEYETGLRAGVHAMAHTPESSTALSAPGAAAATLESPLGVLFLLATPDGIARVAFPEHGDANSIRTLARSRRGSRQGSDHLSHAIDQLERYFAAGPFAPECEADWKAADHAAALRASLDIDYAAQRSYSDLNIELPPRELGRIFGTNPLPILIPCHRVTRGIEVPTDYVGGPERRHWLLRHEREHAGPHR